MSNAEFSEVNRQSEIHRRNVKSFAFSREINLIDTLAKQAAARLHLIKVD
jgi:hypothetical protein